MPRIRHSIAFSNKTHKVCESFHYVCIGCKCSIISMRAPVESRCVRCAKEFAKIQAHK